MPLSFTRRARAFLDRAIARGLAGPDAPEHYAIKRIGEVGLLGAAMGSEGRPLLERAWCDLDEGRRIAAALHRTPASCIVYLPFHIEGLRSTKIETTLADPVWSERLTTELPIVRLVAGVMLEAVNISPPWAVQDVIDELGLFAAPSPDARDEALRVQLMAHVVFWHTRLGRDRGGLARRNKQHFAATLEPWCRKLVQAGDHDSLAEVLGAAACLGLRPPSWGARTLVAAQDDDGWVPARRGVGRTADHFHSTLVSLMAFELGAAQAATVAAAELDLHEQYRD
jgi:hypothetical protein